MPDQQYFELLDELCFCQNHLRLEYLITQIKLCADQDPVRKKHVQTDLEKICKQKIREFVFHRRHDEHCLVSKIKLWLEEFRRLTEIDYEEIMSNKRKVGDT